MAGHIIHELPDGSGLVETRVGFELGGITAFPDVESAWNAVGEYVADEKQNTALSAAVETGRDQMFPYRSMSTSRFMWEAIKSIRIGRFH